MNSLVINSRLQALKLTIINTVVTFDERYKALVNLISLPHMDKDKHLIESIINLLSDEKINIDSRYKLLQTKGISNNVLNACHIFYFNNFSHSKYPLQYRVKSSSYLLSQVPRNEFNSTEVHRFLLKLSRNERIDQATRFECSNILRQYGLKDYREDMEYERVFPVVTLGILDDELAQNRRMNTNLTENRRRTLVFRRTVYEDAQNVHNTSVNESVKESIYNLYKYVKGKNSFFTDKENHNERIKLMNEISMRITFLIKTKDIVIRKKILSSFDRILVDGARFNIVKNEDKVELSLFDVLLLVWYEIKNSKDKEELEKCLLEELLNMNGQCTTGHLSRIVNILSGFSEYVFIKISYKDQIKNYIFNHYNKLVKTDAYRDVILDEILEEDKEKKIYLLKMIQEHSVYVELKKEFVDSKLLELENFNECYQKCIDNYCGM